MIQPILERRRELVEGFPQRCRSLGLNLTPQRIAIYGALATSLEHPSAEGIYDALKRDHPALSLATVYKTLETFQRVGLISLLNVVHETTRYDAETDRHHHLVCERCKRVEDIHDVSLDRLQIPAARKAGFRVRSHSVHFYGLCPDCEAAGQETDDRKTAVNSKRGRRTRRSK